MNHQTRPQCTNPLTILLLAMVAGGLFRPPPAQAQTNHSLSFDFGVACRYQEQGEVARPTQAAPLIGNLAVSAGTPTNSSASYGTSNTYGALNLTAACAAGPGIAGYESGASFGSGLIFGSLPLTNVVAEFTDSLTITSATLPAGTPVQVLVTCVNGSSVSQSFSGNLNRGDAAYCSNYEALIITDTNGGTISCASTNIARTANGANIITNLTNSVSLTVTQFPVGAAFGITNELFAFGEVLIANGNSGSGSIMENLNSVTYVNVLTPGAGYTSASGTVYPALQLWPVLSIHSASEEGMVVSWPASFTNYVLQQNSTLEATNWVSDNDAVSLVDGNYQVAVSPVTNRMFFRLVQP